MKRSILVLEKDTLKNYFVKKIILDNFRT